MYKFVGIFGSASLTTSFLIIVGIISSQVSFAHPDIHQDTRISITDREIIERLTRLETRLEEGQKALNKRIDDLQQTMLWGFGILFAMIIALFGYIVWDRRTALQPIMERTRSLEKLLDALKEYSRKEPKLAEVLRSFGLF